MDQISFIGRVAIVTGAGRGIGRAYALDLAARGAKVVVNDLPGSENAAETVELIVRAGGEACVSLHSVATVEGGENITADAISRFGKVDVLVQNAAILLAGFFDEIDQSQSDTVIDVLLRSLFLVGRPAFRAMRANGYGRIVNISSSASFGLRGMTSYAAAKSGHIGLTNSMALEGEAHGIMVNAVMPYAVTEMAAKGRATMPGHNADEVMEHAKAAMLGRDQASTVAPLVALLASDNCPANGQVFSAIGGRYARVFLGVTDGWVAPDNAAMTAENILTNFDAIRNIDDFTVPVAMRDEFARAAERILALPSR